MTHTTTFAAQQATGPDAVAAALVTRNAFSARYDLDRRTGQISRIGHDLEGQSIVGRILVSPGVQGGVAAGWALLALATNHNGFAGLVFGDVNPVMVQGAVAAGIPVLAGLDPAFFQVVKSGDLLRLEPAKGLVAILPSPVEKPPTEQMPEHLPIRQASSPVLP